MAKSKKRNTLARYGLDFGAQATSIKWKILRIDPNAIWRDSDEYIALQAKMGKRRTKIVKKIRKESMKSPGIKTVELVFKPSQMFFNVLTRDVIDDFHKLASDLEKDGYKVTYLTNAPKHNEIVTSKDKQADNIDDLYKYYQQTLANNSDLMGFVGLYYTLRYIPLQGGKRKPKSADFTVGHAGYRSVKSKKK